MKFKNKFVVFSSLALCFSLFSCGDVVKHEVYYSFSCEVEGSWGTVEGTENGDYIEGTEISLTAIVEPGSGAKFDGYYIDGTSLLETNTNLVFTLNREISLVAKFSLDSVEPDDPDDPTPTPEPDENYNTQTFYHKFDANEFSSGAAGTTDNINGLVFNYSSFEYKSSNSQKGVQFGSNNRPNNASNPFTLTATNIPSGVKLTGYELCLGGNSGKVINYELSINEETSIASTFTGDASTYLTFSSSSIDAEIKELSLWMWADSSAVYLYSISYTFAVPKDNTTFIVTSDKGGSGSNEGDKVVPGENGIPNTIYTVTSLESYYQGVDLTLSGSALRNELYESIQIQTKYNYGQSRYALMYIDENPEKYGYVLSIYDGTEYRASWDGNAGMSREHVWACNHMDLGDTPGNGDTNQGSDLHNLRVCERNVNSSRGNKFFDNENTTSTYYPNLTSTYDFRGDVARIIFYMYVAYQNLGLTVVENPATGSKQSGVLSTLIEWNKADPVDDFEKQRNDRIFEYQGNRNPFIDYPNLVDNLF